MDTKNAGSLIRASVNAMNGYVPGEQPKDPLVIKLNTNENPYPPSPKVVEALHNFNEGLLRRYPEPVSAKVREVIAELHGCSPAMVFVGNGSDEILALCTRAFVENEGSIGYFSPSYSLYPVLADIRDVEKRPVELGPNFEWQMPEDYSASLFVITNPNAPTGMLFPFDVVKNFCRTFEGLVVIDEAYVDFSSRNCMELAKELDNVLVMRTLSKSFSLAGIRVGYVVGAPELIEALIKIKDSYNVNVLSQTLALAALSDIEYMQENVKRIIATRTRVMTALEELGHQVYPSETNFVWFRPVGVSAKELFDRLTERHILIRYFPGERTGEFLRVTIGTDEEIDAFVESVREA